MPSAGSTDLVTTLDRRERRERSLTIGAVCKRLKDEFPDISISKIRYLEDQGLLAPQRTQGGYRLFSEEDVERLRMVLQLQRDEFLPLRVIRQELTLSTRVRSDHQRSKSALRAPKTEVDFETLRHRTGAGPSFVRELEDFGLLVPRVEAGERLYQERDVDVVAVCLRLSEYGVEPRNLRSFRTGADREANLLEQVVSPSLRSRNPEHRREGLEELEQLGAIGQELSQLLFWKALRSLVE